MVYLGFGVRAEEIHLLVKNITKHLCLALLICLSPIHTTYAANKEAFIQRLLPIIQAENQSITAEREQLLELYQHYQSKRSLNAEQEKWLVKTAEEYKLEDFVLTNDDSWSTLIARIDIVPNSLILSQAILESGWGESRFAVDGNNYFGIRCYRVGCGLVPRERDANSKFEVRRFKSIGANIKSYLHTISTFHAYSDFRTLRKELRNDNKPLDSLILAAKLSR